jgi:hypothetical protein
MNYNYLYTFLFIFYLRKVESYDSRLFYNSIRETLPTIQGRILILITLIGPCYKYIGVSNEEKV